jgi:hypothetical protein
LHIGAFVEYQATTYFNSPGSNFISNLIIEKVVKVFPNSTFAYNLTVVFLNYSEISPSSVLDNLSCPSTFYFINHPGDKMIPRSIGLTLVNYTNGTYVYEGTQNVQGVTLKYFYFVNSTGVPSKIEIFQYSVTGELVSKTVYKLISSNLINPNATLYIPDNLTQAKTIKIVIEGPDYYFGEYVVLFNLIAIPTIILLKRKIFR